MTVTGGKAEASFAATMRGLALAGDLGPASTGLIVDALRQAVIAAQRHAGRVAGALNDTVIAALPMR